VILSIKSVENEAVDDGGFPDGLVAKEDKLELVTENGGVVDGGVFKVGKGVVHEFSNC
jgi:hypothetical protein